MGQLLHTVRFAILKTSRMFWRLAYCCCMLLAFSVYARAQKPDLKFTALTNKQGLLSNTINAIVKDNDGLIWLGTPDGLSKYDGRQFRLYRLGGNVQASSASNEVTCVYKDKSGTLWVGTVGRGLFYYDRAGDEYKQFKSDKPGQQLSQRIITSVCEDGAGRLWVATVNGLDVINPVNKTVDHFKTGLNTPGVIPVRSIGGIFKDNAQRMWVCTSAGLYLYDKGRRQFIAFKHDANDAGSLPADAVMTVAQDKVGHIWVGTVNGLSRLKDDGKHFINYRYNDKDEESLCGDIVYSIAADDKDHIWVGTEGGLNVMNVNTGQCYRYRHDPRDPYSLNSKSIRNIYIDPAGIYWIGTYMGGLNKFDKNLTLFKYIQSSELDPFGLNGSLVTAFAQKDEDEIYVGTDGGGVSIFNSKTSRFSRVAITPKEKTNAAGLPVLAMQADHKGQLWIGTFNHGLFKLNMHDNSYRQYTGGSEKQNISQNSVFCLKEDRMGQIWIGTNGMGVNIYDPKADTFRKVPTGYAAVRGHKLPLNGYIRALEEDGDGNVWIGSYGTGIAVYHPLTKIFDIYNQANTGLPLGNIMSLTKDYKGNMWIGTWGNGIFCYDHALKKIVPYNYNAQLPNGVICKIVQDHSGNIWLSTNGGICRIDNATRKLSNYCQFNGLQNSVFLNGAGLVTHNGTIYFGGIDGFNCFQDSDIKQNLNLPPVVFTAFTVENRSVSAGVATRIPVNISGRKQVEIKYKQDFSISFAALNYTLPQRNRYAYILEGFNNTWKYAGTSATANYTNIDPGEYTFKVKACNNDGKWNNQLFSLKIIIKPPFWMTTYAYFLYVVLLLTVLWLIRQQGVKKLKKKMVAEQELKAAEAKHELNELKIKFLTNLSHEFRTPISLIMSPIDKILAQQNGHAISEQLGVVRRNARRLLNLVNQLLDFKKLEENELKLNLSDGEFISFAREVTDSFHDLAESKKVKLNFKTATEKLYIRFDLDKIERILFNLLSNAFKFSFPGGEVSVEVEEPILVQGADVYQIGIIVKDTGAGISKEQLANIFERFYQADAPSAILNQGSGIGLSIARELVALHGGHISAESELGKGAKFRFLIKAPAIQMAEHAEPLSIRQSSLMPKAPVAQGVAVNGPHILIIEDNDDMRRHLTESLNGFYRVSEAVNGREGWQKALSVHPDLIVSDISMPYMDGIELSRKIRLDKRTCHIPIILLTALATHQDQLAGLELGVNDYLTKPFNLEILNIKIRNLLQLNNELKETYQKKIKVIPADIEIESSSEKFIKDVVLYVEKNMNHPKFSVEDISHHFSMSRGSFYNRITELTNESPVEFIRSIKLNKAAVLLEKSDLTIAEIAYSIGFSTPHYFTRSFKSKYNVLPSEYRGKKLTIKNMVDV